jgi:hypothetical protein
MAENPPASVESGPLKIPPHHPCRLGRVVRTKVAKYHVCCRVNPPLRYDPDSVHFGSGRTRNKVCSQQKRPQKWRLCVPFAHLSALRTYLGKQRRFFCPPCGFYPYCFGGRKESCGLARPGRMEKPYVVGSALLDSRSTASRELRMQYERVLHPQFRWHIHMPTSIKVLAPLTALDAPSCRPGIAPSSPQKTQARPAWAPHTQAL